MRPVLKDKCITNKFSSKSDTIPDGINCRQPEKRLRAALDPGANKKERPGERYGRRKEKDMDLPSDSRPRGDTDRSDLLLQRTPGAGSRRVSDKRDRGGVLCLLMRYSILRETGT